MLQWCQWMERKEVSGGRTKELTTKQIQYGNGAISLEPDLPVDSKENLPMGK